jgi:type II secretory ATPase GspE/PulE/Tfp pilus assembly ATPase PilB-like protein
MGFFLVKKPVFWYNNTMPTNLQNINQTFKERDIQERARILGLPYVSLLAMPTNPDLASIMSKTESEKAQAVPFLRIGKKVRFAILDPENEALKAFVKSLEDQKYEVNLSLCSEESLKSAQKIYFTEEYEKRRAILENVVVEEDLGSFLAEVGKMTELREKIESSPFDAALNYVQVGAYKSQASDVHFEPEDGTVFVRLRIDGILTPVFELSPKAYDGMLTQIKQLSHLKLNVHDQPQDGQYRFLMNGRPINVRVSLLPTHFGEACVMRLLDSGESALTLEQLGFEGQALKHLQESIQLPHGMILVTGPTGSGKTTTLYSMLQTIDTKAKKVITLEDPIEYDLIGISQSQVSPEKGYNFSDGLRAILRQDPDIIMVGEIRDFETAETASQASITGHLVISTLHTNSAVESIPRLVNMGVKGFILAPAMDLIIAQRLVRKLCTCATEQPISETEKARIQDAFTRMQEKGTVAPLMPVTLKHAAGCDKCGNTGYKGQIAIAEVLRFDSGLRDLILNSAPMPQLYNYVDHELKMTSLFEDGISKVINGVTTLDEVERVSV